MHTGSGIISHFTAGHERRSLPFNLVAPWYNEASTHRPLITGFKFISCVCVFVKLFHVNDLNHNVSIKRSPGSRKAWRTNVNSVEKSWLWPLSRLLSGLLRSVTFWRPHLQLEVHHINYSADALHGWNISSNLFSTDKLPCITWGLAKEAFKKKRKKKRGELESKQ